MSELKVSASYEIETGTTLRAIAEDLLYAEEQFKGYGVSFITTRLKPNGGQVVSLVFEAIDGQ